MKGLVTPFKSTFGNFILRWDGVSRARNNYIVFIDSHVKLYPMNVNTLGGFINVPPPFLRVRHSQCFLKVDAFCSLNLFC